MMGCIAVILGLILSLAIMSAGSESQVENTRVLALVVSDIFNGFFLLLLIFCRCSGMARKILAARIPLILTEKKINFGRMVGVP